MKTYLVSILVVAIYLGTLLALFISFPKTMITRVCGVWDNHVFFDENCAL